VIALIDYGAGNLASVRKALAALGADFMTPAYPADIEQARGVIIPGVGHFRATRALGDEWRAAIRSTLDRGAALLGVCLGMQWLYEGSDEAPGLRGLGVIRGHCIRLDSASLKVPHVGWNSLDLPRPSSLLAGIVPAAQVYFTHSYICPVTPETAAITEYGWPFAAAVESGRIAGVQFHPEKSGDVGLRILRNWLDAL
jgi:glutamine amidotransferase